jgi:hypothetical protein
VIAEVVGGADPEGIVLLGGHVDSWDVGTGAVDDGAGFFCGSYSASPGPITRQYSIRVVSSCVVW